MWPPSTWSDALALLGHATETPSLEFKRGAPGAPGEVAKDIAAMTVNGGVLIYGIDEDHETRTAAELTPFSIRGVEERIQQIAATRVAPAPSIETVVIADESNPATGVIAVVILASGGAPHQADGRYPARTGTVTRYLEEREIERLYQQRADVGAGPKTRRLY